MRFQSSYVYRRESDHRADQFTPSPANHYIAPLMQNNDYPPVNYNHPSYQNFPEFPLANLLKSLSGNPTNLTKIGREDQEAYQEGEREPGGWIVSLQSKD